ncbi:hypothetical protein C7T94_01315 [Pedobacter yulinensis]|uniref:Coproporphyrinogen III oxidase n=1 Tax=Pedobacter yulinensis TaxID=2126353 RepID=A0A2T3HQW7_9SPHI|nr:hypothetical protein [Pedobacter yulinensis]PST84793.1 hypothetical protein C7T94_01315 [Pedobacter yulinensis]
MKTTRLFFYIALSALSLAACTAGDKGGERTPDSVEMNQGDSAASGMGTPATGSSDSSSGDTTMGSTDTSATKGGRP